MTWTFQDIPSQLGRVAVVTGANSGLGLETTRCLAAAGAHVVMGVRDVQKGGSARREILGDLPTASLEVSQLDLGALASIGEFAARTKQAHPRIDLLANNAGVMGTPRKETADAFELQFGTNHLGHFALTAQLAPALLDVAGARIVTVTSFGRHYRWPYDRKDIHLNHRYHPWRAYGRSKLANLHFAIELNDRLRAARAPAISLTANPGFSHTNLQTTSAQHAPGGRSQAFFARTVPRLGMSARDGARAQLRALTDPRAKGGQLYAPRWGSNGPPVRRPLSRWSVDKPAMRELWEISEQETGISFDVAAAAG